MRTNYIFFDIVEIPAQCLHYIYELKKRISKMIETHNVGFLKY